MSSTKILSRSISSIACINICSSTTLCVQLQAKMGAHGEWKSRGLPTCKQLIFRYIDQGHVTAQVHVGLFHVWMDVVSIANGILMWQRFDVIAMKESFGPKQVTGKR